MGKTDSLLERTPLESCTVGELIKELASDGVLPGAGAAACIALALAAACAGKAVAITLAHQNAVDNKAANNKTDALEKLRAQFTELAETALKLAREDALKFKKQMNSGNKASETKDLIETDEEILVSCRKLKVLLDKNESLIDRNMKGDWLAARTLSKACYDINTGNLHELEVNLAESA